MAELTRQTHGPEFWARHDGVCKLCKEEIKKGEHVLVVVDGKGTCHAECGVGYCQAINENLPEDEAA